MISAPTGITAAAYATAINSGSPTHVRFTFASGTVLEDQDIEASGLVLRDVLNGETNLTFGRAVMKELTVSLLNSDRLVGIKWDEEFQFEMGVDVEEDEEIVTKWVTIGYFTGQRPEKIHYVNVIQFTAYDRMQWFDIPAKPVMDYLYANFTWPMSAKNIYYNMVEYVGGNMGHSASSSFSSGVGNRTFEKDFISGEGMTCRDILALLAESGGLYAMVQNTGRMMLGWYSNYTQPQIRADTEFSVEAADVGSGITWNTADGQTWNQLETNTWADLGGYQQVFGLDGLDVKQTEDDVGVHYGNTVGNLYTIVDNPFLVIREPGDAETYIKQLWDKLQSFGGRLPVRVECVGNWLVQAGDIIYIQVYPGSGSSTIVRVPIFTHELHWSGHPTSIYECTGEIQRPAMSATVREKLTNGSRYHKFVVDLDSLESEIGDVAGNVTSLGQNVNGISTRVENTEGQVSSLEQRAGNIETSVANKLDKTSAYQDVGDIIEEAQSLANSAETAAKNASIAKTSTYQDASSIVSAAVSQAATAAGNTYIAKTTTYQTADSIVSAAVSQAGTAAGNTYIAKTSTYQTANSIVNAAKSYTDNELTDYSTTTQTATQISQYVANNAYGKQSGITIDANGVSVTGSKKVEIKSGGSFEVNATNFKIDSANKKVEAGKWSFTDGGLKYTDTSGAVFEIKIDSNDGSPTFYFKNQYNQIMYMSIADSTQSNQLYFRFNRPVLPSTTYVDLGSDPEPWQNVYAVNLWGNVMNTSSRDVKHDILPMSSMGERLDKLVPVTFKYNKDEEGRTRHGLIYEDTIETMPEICTGDKDSKPEDKGINYLELVPMLLKEVQELRKRVSDLEIRVNELEGNK